MNFVVDALLPGNKKEFQFTVTCKSVQQSQIIRNVFKGWSLASQDVVDGLVENGIKSHPVLGCTVSEGIYETRSRWQATIDFIAVIPARTLVASSNLYFRTISNLCPIFCSRVGFRGIFCPIAEESTYLSLSRRKHGFDDLADRETESPQADYRPSRWIFFGGKTVQIPFTLDF